MPKRSEIIMAIRQLSHLGYGQIAREIGAPYRSVLKIARQIQDGKRNKNYRGPKQLVGEYNIYFIQEDLDGPIKIGRAANIFDRFHSIQTSNHRIMYLLGAIWDCEKYYELELHERFAHLRLRGEWFEPGHDLVMFISSKADKDFDHAQNGLSRPISPKSGG